jgi:dihydrofolate reductase
MAVEQKYPDKNVFVIGGADLLVKAKPVIKTVYVTRIAGDFDCDTRIDVDEFLKGFELTSEYDLGSCVIGQYVSI